MAEKNEEVQIDDEVEVRDVVSRSVAYVSPNLHEVWLKSGDKVIVPAKYLRELVDVATEASSHTITIIKAHLPNFESLIQLNKDAHAAAKKGKLIQFIHSFNVYILILT